MAAPKGSFTPKSGPLAGTVFELRPGDAPTAPYNRYQTARSQALGYRSYQQERAILGISLVSTLRDRAVQSGAMTPSEATKAVGEWYRAQSYKGRSARPGGPHSVAQGQRKNSAIRWAIEHGLYDYGDDAAEDIPY